MRENSHCFALVFSSTDSGRQRLRSLRLHFQVSNGYFNYLFLPVVVFDVFDLISLDLV